MREKFTHNPPLLPNQSVCLIILAAVTPFSLNNQTEHHKHWLDLMSAFKYYSNTGINHHVPTSSTSHHKLTRKYSSPLDILLIL